MRIIRLDSKPNFLTALSFILIASVVSSPLSRLQTFQKAEAGEEAQCEPSAEEKSPLVKSLSESTPYRRKSMRGSSVSASERGKEEKGKSDNDKDETEEVRL